MVISVGYRVKSQRGVEFRRWATDVLRRYIIEGHVANEKRLEQLGQVARIMARIPDSLRRARFSTSFAIPWRSTSLTITTTTSD